MIFDGKAFARQIETKLRAKLQGGVKVPKIVSVLVGNDPASELYTRLKKQAAERVGLEFEIVRLELGSSSEDLESRIKQIGEQSDVTGVMVQLPLPGLSATDTQVVLKSIPLQKDVDGLRWEESKILPATVRAILSIIDEIAADKKIFSVLGARGAVGRPLVYFLKQRGLTVNEIEWDTENPGALTLQSEVVISCVGKADLVTGEMVSNQTIAIDVGMSEIEGKVVGDMSQEVYQKASVAVPVPGGVGPVTIVSLMANAINIYE